MVMRKGGVAFRFAESVQAPEYGQFQPPADQGAGIEVVALAGHFQEIPARQFNRPFAFQGIGLVPRQSRLILQSRVNSFPIGIDVRSRDFMLRV